MRIHSLHIEAIGPFPGSHDVDFDELSAGGLFLLEGPTGAGKSTLIDAITYGLYGTLGTAEDTRLPSNHAPFSEPVIEVVFSTTAGIYKTKRTPPFRRPKKRGEGFVAEKATAKLWRLSSVNDEVGEPMSFGAQEVGSEVRGLLKLNRDQFMQTVVLPQGRFSTFLRAKPDERAAVLRDVFGTAIYQQVQDQLMEMSRTARRTITAAQADVSSAVRAFASLLTVDDPAAANLREAGSALDTDEMVRISREVLGVQEQRRHEAEGAKRAAQDAETAARTFLEWQKDLARTLTRRGALLAENAILLERSNDVAHDRELLATAQRAAAVTGVLRSHASAIARVEGAHQALTVACSDLHNTQDQDLTLVEDLSALRSIIDDVTGERGALVDLVRLELSLPDRSQQLSRAESDLQDALTLLEQETAVLACRPELRHRITSQRDELRRSAIPVSAARQTADQCRAIRDAAKRAETLATQLVAAGESLGRAGVVARDVTGKENAIRLRWINSTAGALATNLEEGAPCPVCGGVEHPAPAPELADHASLDDVDEATEVRERAVATLQEADRAHLRLTGEVAVQQGVAKNTSVPDADAALAAAQAHVTAAEEAVVLLEKVEREIVEFDAATDAIRVRTAAAGTTTATTVERLRGDSLLLRVDEERCTIAAGDCGSVTMRSHALDTRLARVRKLAVVRQDHHDAQHRLTDAKADLDEALHDAEFPGADAARAAQLGHAESAELQQRVREHDAALARVASGLAEEAVTTLTGDEVADVPAALQGHDDCQTSLMAASAADATACASLEQCHRARQALTTVLSRHRRLAEEAAPALRMAELANAGEGNAKSTTLSTFVLLRRFEDVVAAANDRLTIMSGGRFALLRIDEREGRARKAGLGLSVRDHHTETNRDPHTLSGGETFYVSLCLALGLADVVTSEAGGISLDTLFIDEGFGSLDSETLDGVLGELAHLQADGRAVGIVSHVAELKARIPERVEITRRVGGGSTLVVKA